MTEQDQTKEQVNREELSIKPEDVLKELELFARNTMAGYPTHAGRLMSYRQLMGSVAGFFSQPQVARHPTAQTRELVSRLFYHHENTTAMPVDFFIDTKEKLTHEVLEDGRFTPGSVKLADELILIRNLSQRELQTVTLRAQGEITDQAKLVVLSAKEVPGIADQAIEAEIISQDTLRQRVQERAIGLLAKQDKTLAQDIDDRDAYIKTLEDLALNYDPERVAGALAQYETYLKKADGSSAVDEVKRRLFLDQHKNVRQILEGLAQDAKSPEFMWKQWVEKGIIPASLLDSFEEVANLAELNDVVQTLSGMPKEVKAKHLVPFLQKGISATMLTELAEGRFEFSEDFVEQQIDAFIHFYDTVKPVASSQKRVTFKRALVTAALIAAVAWEVHSLTSQSTAPQAHIAENIIASLPAPTPTSLPQLTPVPRPTSLPIPTVIKKPANSFQWTEPDADQIGAELAQQVQALQQSQPQNESLSAVGGLNQQLPAPLVSESASMPDSGIGRPQNESAEEFLRALQTTVWRIKGSDVSGHYRTGTASYFDEATLTWVGRNIAKVSKTTTNAKRTDITISRDEKVASQILNLPTKGNFAPAGWIINGAVSRGRFLERADGTFFMYFAKEDIGKRISLSVDFGKVDGPVIPDPTQEELQDMSQNFISLNDMPADMRQAVSAMENDPSVTAWQKALWMENYIKQNFLYSLDTKWNAYYYSGVGAKEFFQKIAEIKKTDCDMANTALVFLLRHQGIPARMAFGFANGQSRELTQGQNHGWVEIYINGQWITLDATPVNMDDFTQNALKGKIPPGSSLPAEISLDIVASNPEERILETTLPYPVPTLTAEQLEKVGTPSPFVGENSQSTSQPGSVESQSTPEAVVRKPIKEVKPRNRPVEQIEINKKIIDWTISQELSYLSTDYYRTDTAWQFNHNTQSWRISPDGSEKKWDSQNAPGIDKAKIFFTSPVRFDYGRQLIQLPVGGNSVLVGYAIGDNSLDPQADAAIRSSSGVMQKSDGTYWFYIDNIPQSATNKNINFSFGVADKQYSKNPVWSDVPPSKSELTQMKEQLVGIGNRLDFPLGMGRIELSQDSLNLPQDTLDFLQELRNHQELSEQQKAKAMEQYIKKTFRLSFNPAWSDFYHQGKDTGAFINRIFEVKKADVDVANTALVALLRSQGIPSRMVFGYVHSDDGTHGRFRANLNQLNLAEKRGWVESYVDNHWITLDAEPDLSDWSKNEDAAVLLYSIKDYVKENPIEAFLELVTLLNTLAYGYNWARRMGNKKLASHLYEEVGKRAGQYIGDQYNGVWWRLVGEEREKVEQGSFDSSYPFPFKLIPPFSLLDIKPTSSKVEQLKNFPYARDRVRVRSTTEPDMADFLINVLGYKESEVRAKMQRKAYDEVRQQLETATRNDLFGTIPAVGATNNIYYGLNDLEKPDDEIDWERMKQEFKSKMYNEYLSESGKGRKNAETLSDHSFSEEEFNRCLDRLLQYRLALWAAEDAYTNLI